MAAVAESAGTFNFFYNSFSHKKTAPFDAAPAHTLMVSEVSAYAFTDLGAYLDFFK